MHVPNVKGKYFHKVKIICSLCPSASHLQRTFQNRGFTHRIRRAGLRRVNVHKHMFVVSEKLLAGRKTTLQIQNEGMRISPKNITDECNI